MRYIIVLFFFKHLVKGVCHKQNSYFIYSLSYSFLEFGGFNAEYLMSIIWFVLFFCQNEVFLFKVLQVLSLIYVCVIT